ncbi:MAG: hypothetical protein WC471_03335 [Candidatus Woesearchaeota archaeon]
MKSIRFNRKKICRICPGCKNRTFKLIAESKIEERMLGGKRSIFFDAKKKL